MMCFRLENRWRFHTSRTISWDVF